MDIGVEDDGECGGCVGHAANCGHAIDIHILSCRFEEGIIANLVVKVFISCQCFALGRSLHVVVLFFHG